MWQLIEHRFFWNCTDFFVSSHRNNELRVPGKLKYWNCLSAVSVDELWITHRRCIFYSFLFSHAGLVNRIWYWSFFTCLVALCRCHRANQISLQYCRALVRSNCFCASVREQISEKGESTRGVKSHPGWGSTFKFQLLSKKKPMIIIRLLNQDRVCVWVGEITVFW